MTIHSTNCDARRTASIAQVVTATAEVLGQEITATAAEMIATDLAEYPDQQITLALQACRRELTGRLTLAAVLERIQRTDGHPDPNEAWAIALRATDESSSVGMTKQIAAALQAASPVLNIGDEVGGRMAFLDSYKRELANARSEREPAKWYLSAGHCPNGRVEELDRMKRAGLLSDADHVRQLEHHGQQALLSPEASAVAALITGKPASEPLASEEVREKIRELRETLRAKAKERGEKQAERSRIEREHHHALVAKHEALMRGAEATA